MVNNASIRPAISGGGSVDGGSLGGHDYNCDPLKEAESVIAQKQTKNQHF